MKMNKMLKEYLGNSFKLATIVFTASFVSVFIFLMALNIMIPLTFSDTIQTFAYEKYYDYYENDPYVINITNQCYDLPDDFQRIRCVHQDFKEKFVYLDREVPGLLSPEKTIVEGGVCRDATGLFCTVFTKMGLECKPVFKSGEHVLAAVWLKTPYVRICLVDMYDLSCI